MFKSISRLWLAESVITIVKVGVIYSDVPAGKSGGVPVSLPSAYNWKPSGSREPSFKVHVYGEMPPVALSKAGVNFPAVQVGRGLFTYASGAVEAGGVVRTGGVETVLASELQPPDKMRQSSNKILTDATFVLRYIPKRALFNIFSLMTKEFSLVY